MFNDVKTTGGARVSLIAMLFLCAPALGHVQLLAPNGGEEFVAGSTTTVVWVTSIPHDTENWDLYYSVAGAGGPWIDLALDLPVGNSFPGATHRYDWEIPGEIFTEWARVRVVQDNGSYDYQDVSNADFTIIPEPGTLGMLIGAGLVLCRGRRASMNLRPGESLAPKRKGADAPQSGTNGPAG